VEQADVIEKLIPLIINNALRGKDLPVYGDGSNVRDWLYVYDHCDAILSVIENGSNGETYNIGGEFELINQDGQIVTDKDIFKEPTILYFGYTFCPDICPLDVYRNAEAVDLLDKNEMSVTPVFVSIDPERDTPEVIGDFVKYHHPKMIGLTGSKDQIDHVSKVYKTYYKAQNSNDDLYLVDHSTLSYLILPKYGFVEFFRRDKSADEIANITACFIENS